jgi:beta-glucanase (GH16 family)
MHQASVRSVVTWGVLAFLAVALAVSGVGLVTFAHAGDSASTRNSTAAATNLVRSGSFETIAPWSFIVRSGATAALYQDSSTKVDGTYSALVDVMQMSAAMPWAVQLRQTGIRLSQGQPMSLSFWAKGSTTRAIQVVLQQSTSPYNEYFNRSVNIGSSWRQYNLPLTSATSDATSMLAFNLAQANGSVWLDGVALTPTPSAPTAPATSGVPTASATSATSAAPTASATSATSAAPATSVSPTATTPAAPAGWHLIWSDEFNGTSVDTTKWNIENQASGGYRVCCLFYGLQYWTPQDVTEQSGVLQIESEQRSMGGKNYTSGAISTDGKLDFLYGRVDIRAKLPTTQGMWPAFWMVPQAPGPAQFEIDQMELLGQNPGTVYMTNHWNGQGNQQQCVFNGADFSQAYHDFTLDWEPGSITWYIDGVQHCQITQGVSNLPLYLIINTAVGGSWVGSPNSSTVFPQYMDLDYVRVYQAG